MTTYNVKYIDALLYKTGSPTDNVYIEIRSGSQTGTLLGTSNAIVASTLIVGSNPSRFTFATAVTVTVGTKYYFVMYRSGSRDVSNNVGWAITSTTALPDGGWSSSSSGTWSSENTADRFINLIDENYISHMCSATSSYSTFTSIYGGTGTYEKACLSITIQEFYYPVPVIATTTNILELASVGWNTTLPSGTAAGDLLLAIIAKDDDPLMSSSHSMTDLFGSGLMGGDYSSSVFYKFPTSTDITRGYMTFTGDSEDYAGRLYRIVGVNPTTPIGTTGTPEIGSDTSPTAAAISAGVSSLVFAFSGFDDSDTPYGQNSSGSFAIEHNVDGTSTGIIISRCNITTAATTNACAFTSYAADGSAAVQFAINGYTAPRLTLLSPEDASVGITDTPEFQFIGIDPSTFYDLEYQIGISTVNIENLELGVIAEQPVRTTSSGLSTTWTELGFSFVGTGHSLGSLTVGLYKNVTPTGTLTAKLYATSSGLPTGAALETSSTTIVIEDLPASDPAGFNRTFYFSGDSLLGSGTTYVLVVVATFVIPSSGVWEDRAGELTGVAGCMVAKISGIWYQYTYYDVMYRIETYYNLLVDSSVPDDGFLNVDNESDTHPFTNANIISYALQDAITELGTYYWRVRTKANTAPFNTWGTWSSTYSLSYIPTVALNTPVDEGYITTVDPSFTFTGEDVLGTDLEYNIVIVSSAISPGIVASNSQTVDKTYDYYTGSNNFAGQAFEATDSGDLTSVKFMLHKVGAPPGNITVQLWSLTGTYGTNARPNVTDPTGTPLATADTIAASTLGTSAALVEFTFTGAQQYALVEGSRYGISFKYSSGDASNKVVASQYEGASSYAGNTFSYIASTWYTGLYDKNFEVYADLPTIITDSDSSVPDAGFYHDETDSHPFDADATITYTIQESVELSVDEDYTWKVRVKPTGGAWEDFTAIWDFTVHLSLEIQDSSHSLTSENVVVVATEPGGSLTIQNSIHTLTSENVTIVYHPIEYSLVVQNSAHVLTSDNVVLTHTTTTLEVITYDGIDFGSITPHFRFKGADGLGHSMEYIVQILEASGSIDLAGFAAMPVESCPSRSCYNGWSGHAQGFKCRQSGNLHSAKFYLRGLAGTVSGNVTVRLYSDSAGNPGSTLATATLVDATAFPTTYGWYTFTFPTGQRYAMTASTWYFIGINYSAGSSPSEGFQLADYYDSGGEDPVFNLGQPSLYYSGAWHTQSYVYYDSFPCKVYNSVSGYVDLIEETTSQGTYINVEDGGDTHPFNNGQIIDYTIASSLLPLDNGTYYWRVFPRVFGEQGTWSAIQSFIVSSNARFELVPANCSHVSSSEVPTLVPHTGGAGVVDDSSHAVSSDNVTFTHTLDIEINTADGPITDTTPTLEFTGIEGFDHNLEYEIKIWSEELIDFLESSYYSTYASISGSLFGDREFGQSFMGVAGQLGSVSFWMRKSGVYSANNVNVYLKEHTGTFGVNGTAQFTDTYDTATPIPQDSLSTDFEWVTFIFPEDSRYTMTEGVPYFITTTFFDSANSGNAKLHVGYNTTGSGNAAGNAILRDFAGNWGYLNNYDAIFRYYTEELVVDADSTTDAGFANTIDGGDTHPFNPSDKIGYTVQSALTGNEYRWKVRVTDGTQTTDWEEGSFFFSTLLFVNNSVHEFTSTSPQLAQHYVNFALDDSAHALTSENVSFTGGANEVLMIITNM